MPGIRKKIKISVTILAMRGEPAAARPPLAARQLESSGNEVTTRITAVTIIDSKAICKPFLSTSVKDSSAGASARSPSTSVAASLGSITLSVRYQPTPTTNKHEADVKNQLFNGLSVSSGSIICAAAWLIPCSNGSIIDGTKFALNPPDTPAKAQAIPAKG